MIVGEKIPLFLNVGDENEDLFVQAEIVLPDGSTSETINLIDLGQGCYGDNSYSMPNEKFVNVIYTCWLDEGYTEKAAYYDVTETFERSDDCESDLQDINLECKFQEIAISATSQLTINLEKQTVFNTLEVDNLNNFLLTKDYPISKLECNISEIKLNKGC